MSKEKDGFIFESSDIFCSMPSDFVNNFDIFANITDDAGSTGQNGSGFSDLDNQETMEFAQGLDFELNQFENTIVRWAEKSVGKKRRTGAQSASKAQVVTHEDFEDGPQRDAFLLIFGYAELLFDSEDENKIHQGLKFFFGESSEDITFEDAAHCIDPSIRTDVVRLRFIFEFWLRDWKLVMPRNTIGLPNRVELSASQYGQHIGIDLAREAWFEPGIEMESLIKLALIRNPFDNREKVLLSLNNLLAYHVISEGIVDGVSRFYTTGKNPILKLEELLATRAKVNTSLDRIQWTRQF